MIPDGEGNLHLVNVLEMFETEAESRFFFNAERDTVFMLFTPNGPEDGEIIRLNDADSLAASNFNPSHPTRFTIHGWNGGRRSSVNRLNREAFFSRGNFNMITVDWSDGAFTLNYIAARNRVWQVGPVVARFIEFLVNNAGLNPSDVNVIGHSLGAHVSGMTGKSLQIGRIGTIFGLDAAGPMFYVRNPEDRLHIGDAEYVEAIFTNAGTLGFGSPIGDSTFYPNGGSSQPGCGIDASGACAHERVNRIFAESIRTGGFTSTPCYESEIRRGRCTREGPRAVMGGQPSNRGRGVEGIYWLETTRSSPFSLG